MSFGIKQTILRGFPILLEFLLPFRFQFFDVRPIFKPLPQRAITQQNVDGQFLPFVFIRWRIPPKLIFVNLSERLEQDQPQPVWTKQLPIRNVNLETVA